MADPTAAAAPVAAPTMGAGAVVEAAHAKCASDCLLAMVGEARAADDTPPVTAAIVAAAAAARAAAAAA